jgi:hypothetical protein
VLRDKNSKLCDRVVTLERELEGARRSLEGTHELSPCEGCARDAAAAMDAEARARAAEARASALAVEVGPRCLLTVHQYTTPAPSPAPATLRAAVPRVQGLMRRSLHTSACTRSRYTLAASFSTCSVS